MNIVDTSVVTKWLFREKYSDEALLVLENEKEFFAPGYLRIEFFSSVSKKVRAGFLEIQKSKIILRQFQKLSLHFVPYSELEYLAFEISTEYPITFYDAIFIVTAIDQNKKLYTFDFKLKKSVNNTELDEIVIIPA
ncbi:MAG: PIN domain-containing protein [Bacteroidetes bacterium]|jgi:predicted nucleic acid-binding protein|nr:PIN domain-containing protein [Bacteroidota bacterium]